jgi:hypothetical protein
VDGDAVSASPHRATLAEAGFAPAYRGMALRPSARGATAAAGTGIGRGAQPSGAGVPSRGTR